MSFLVEDEIISQPQCWTRAAELAPQLGDALPADGERVAYIGCGTSWFMAQAISVLRESLGKGEGDAFTASEFPYNRSYDRVVAITRSGTTSEVIEVLTKLQGKTRTTVILGTQDTPAHGVADHVVDLSFADEQSVVQTRFATTGLAVQRAGIGQDLAPVIAEAEAALQQPLTDAMAAAEQVSFLGVNWSVGLANEAALKFREASSAWAESYPAMDYRHGPISIAEPGRLVWMFGTPPSGLQADVEATGATFISSDRDPLAELVVAQRLAVARAMRLGLNPDQPRNLTRSIILDDDQQS
ncbi:SIS domain-containing protein [Parenemella sanctibonifatiensis]|uniref:Sugar isomerase n=1 Tax=Parenemella sanctibonifatiensis TaxID=2016505 RepID=A0A255EMM5_9ACTN|nr:SIS domain-containing protein [Parenemella sanctibonifatiensis]OYN88478.1 sugar isomerase [Parenemella sanctibonifatiensis]OYN92798.1 sugar isomerase [Parenemella sanctibonifatiensis]